MAPNLPVPTLDEVKRIAVVEDPVVRNLQITQCYHELSALFARSGLAANWCTFATWASKQAGQTIRKEDLTRLLERRLKRSPATLRDAAPVVPDTTALAGSPAQLALDVRHFETPMKRASAAVSRGNKKVFEEIGYEFARFYHTCLRDKQLEPHYISRFCGGLRPGEPPEGQGYLRQAFAHYAKALSEEDPVEKAQLILLANIEIGFHEQTRLQPDIAESLDAGLISSVQFTRLLLAGLFPYRGWFTLINLYLRRLLGRPTMLDLALQRLLTRARSRLRQTITDVMMTFALPSGVELRLGQDLMAGYPDSLSQITNPELKQFLEGRDPTPDSPGDSGVYDWADLPDRLHFIIDLFRCYQEAPEVLAAPFTPEQVAAIKSGRVPAGRL